MLPGIEQTKAIGDLVSLADRDRLARTACYEFLHHNFSAMGELALADIFAGLSEDSSAVLPNEKRPSDHGILLSKPHAKSAGLRCDAASCRTTYDAWALAVDIEHEAETTLIELLGRAKDSSEKLLLMGRIHESYRRAAEYRAHRRAAYHSERIGAKRAAFPDERRIQDAGDLTLVALAIETWFLRLLEMETAGSGGYDRASEMTRSVVARLVASSDGLSVPRRLKKWLDALSKLPKAGDDVGCSEHFLNLKLVAEGGRVFDYYDRVFESAEDEETLNHAQALSRDAAARLKVLRAARPR